MSCFIRSSILVLGVAPLLACGRRVLSHQVVHVQPPSEQTEQRCLGEYCIIQKIGEGAQGSVYQGTRSSDGLNVAIKEYSNKHACAHEAHILQQLQGEDPHPNVVGFFGSMVEHDHCFIVMELVVGGRTLLDVLYDESSEGPSRVSEVFRSDDSAIAALLSQVIAGLEHINRRGVFWVDFKTDNIMITSNGLVKLLDFGVAATKNMLISRLDYSGYSVLPKLPCKPPWMPFNLFPNVFAPPECLLAGGCCLPVEASEIPGKAKKSKVGRFGKKVPARSAEEDRRSKFEALQMVMSLQACPMLVANIADEQVFNSWEVWSVAALEAWCRSGKAHHMPNGLFYAATGSTQEDTWLSVLGRFCPSDHGQSSEFNIPSSWRLVAQDGLHCDPTKRPSLTTLRKLFEDSVGGSSSLSLARERLAIYNKLTPSSGGVEESNESLAP